MSFLRTTVSAAIVATAPFLFAAEQTQASTVTGSIVLNLEGEVIGTGSQGIITDVTFSGAFELDNGLSDNQVVHDLGWVISSVLDYGPGTQTGITGTATVQEYDTAPRSAEQLRQFYNNPMIASLFTAYPFANTAIATALGSGGNASDVGTISGGNITWSITGANFVVPLPLPFSAEGDFEFSTQAPGDVLPFLTTFGFEQINPPGGDPMGLALGSPFSLTLTVTPIPVPAALPLLAGGLAIFGVMGWRRRRAEAA